MIDSGTTQNGTTESGTTQSEPASGTTRSVAASGTTPQHEAHETTRETHGKAHEAHGKTQEAHGGMHDVHDPDNIHGDVTVDELDLEAELAGNADAVATEEVAEYTLWLADDALILAQQLSKWIAHAPELEEDVALGNIALDLLGHARSLLRYAGSATGRTEDDLAYFRDEPEFRSAWMVEQDNGDFAHTIIRQLVMATYMFALYSRLQASTDETLAAIAAKAVKEVEYHRDHAVQWTLRLAGGTEESRARTERALTDLWPFVGELFRDTPAVEALAARGIAVLPSSLEAECADIFTAVLAEEELAVLQLQPSSAGGREGKHFSTLGYLLAEMQVLARRHPGATW